MRESVIYQEILQEGKEEGREEGRQSELRLVMRLLTRRIGVINSQLQSQIENLSLTQLEDLGEALLDFNSETDLINWLNNFVS
jgi:predicted transposase YdaD